MTKISPRPAPSTNFAHNFMETEFTETYTSTHQTTTKGSQEMCRNYMEFSFGYDKHEKIVKVIDKKVDLLSTTHENKNVLNDNRLNYPSVAVITKSADRFLLTSGTYKRRIVVGRFDRKTEKIQIRSKWYTLRKSIQYAKKLVYSENRILFKKKPKKFSGSWKDFWKIIVASESRRLSTILPKIRITQKLKPVIIPVKQLKGKKIRCAYKECVFTALYDINTNKVWFREKSWSLSGAGNEVKRIVNEKRGVTPKRKLTTAGPEFWFWHDTNKSLKKTLFAQKIDKNIVTEKTLSNRVDKKVRDFWASKGCIIWRFNKGGNSIYSIIAQIVFKNAEKYNHVRHTVTKKFGERFSQYYKTIETEYPNITFYEYCKMAAKPGFFPGKCELEVACSLYNLELTFYSLENKKICQIGKQSRRKFKVLQLVEKQNVALVLNFWECARYEYGTFAKRVKKQNKQVVPEEKQFVLPQRTIPSEWILTTNYFSPLKEIKAKMSNSEVLCVEQKMNLNNPKLKQTKLSHKQQTDQASNIFAPKRLIKKPGRKNFKNKKFFLMLFGLRSNESIWVVQKYVKRIFKLYKHEWNVLCPVFDFVHAKQAKRNGKHGAGWKIRDLDESFIQFVRTKHNGKIFICGKELRWVTSNNNKTEENPSFARFQVQKLFKSIRKFRIASQNLRGLYDKGLLFERRLQETEADICACQEIHENPFQKANPLDGYIWVSKPEPVKVNTRKMKRGLAWAIRKEYAHLCTILCNKVLVKNPNTFWMKVRNRNGDEIILCNVYLPIHETSVEQTRSVYNELRDEITFVQKNNPCSPIYMLGDFNSRTAKFFGEFGTDVCNSNGRAMIDFVESLSMHVHNNRLDEYNITRSDDHENVHSIIDYIISLDGQTDSKVRVSRNVVLSDHNLLYMDIWAEVSMKKQTPPEIQIKVKKKLLVCNEELQDEFKSDFERRNVSAQVERMLRVKNVDCLNAAVELVHKELTDSAAKVCGTAKCSPRFTKNWFDNVCREMITEIRELRKVATNKVIVKKKRKKLNKYIRKRKIEVKKYYVKKLLNKMKKRDHTAVWKFIDKVCRLEGGTSIANAWDPEQQKHVTSEEAINRVFTRFYSKLLQKPQDDPMFGKRKLRRMLHKKRRVLEKFKLEIDIEDVMQARYYLKNGKAPGPEDGVPPEFFKYCNFSRWDVGDIDVCLLAIFRHAIEICDVPDVWRLGTAVQLFKKGSKALPDNYRGISLLSVMGKLFGTIVQKKLAEFCERTRVFSKGQNGFRNRRSCNQHIFSFIETCKLVERDTLHGAFVFFLDLRKAFDSVPREKIYERFREVGIEEKTIALFKKIHAKTKCRVRTNKYNGKYFRTTRGVPQGCCLSPITFIIFCDVILQELNASGLAYKLGNDTFAVQLFADDLVIITDTECKLRALIDLCKNVCDAYDLKANVGKCAVMQMESDMNEPITQDFFWNDELIEVVSEYTYLGIIIQSNLKWNLHADKVLKNTTLAFFKIKKFLCDFTIPTKLRLQAFNSMIKPIFDYCCELWTPTAAVVKKIEQKYMQILRKTVGCGKNTGSRVLLELTKCHSRSFFVERFRLLFKYVLCDHDINGLFSLLWPDLEDSNSSFAKWYRKDATFVEFVDEPTRLDLTTNASGNTRFGTDAARAREQSKYDAKVWDTLCDQTFEHNEENVAPLYQFLEPNEFAFLCELLGNHVDLLKPDRRCFYCGEQNSFEHCFAYCENTEHSHNCEAVNLETLLSDEDSIKSEFNKLKNIYDQTVLDSLKVDCTGKKLTINIDGVVGDCIVLARFANSSVYSCRCVLTGTTLNLDIGKLLNKGKISLSRGGAHEADFT